VGGGKDVQNVMIIWNTKKKEGRIILACYGGSRFCGCGGWGGDGTG